jgi:hypothetical protein
LKTPQLNFRLAGEGASKYTQQKAQALISEIMQNSSFSFFLQFISVLILKIYANQMWNNPSLPSVANQSTRQFQKN